VDREDVSDCRRPVTGRGHQHPGCVDRHVPLRARHDGEHLGGRSRDGPTDFNALITHEPHPCRRRLAEHLDAPPSPWSRRHGLPAMAAPPGPSRSNVPGCAGSATAERRFLSAPSVPRGLGRTVGP
jgi:hypothetical protein